MSSPASDMGFVIRAPGGPEVLEWTSLPLPALGPHEVLIAHKAIGINFIDTYYRTGLYPWPATPLILGSEAAGVVVAAGAQVTSLAVGDRVAYTGAPGAYREYRVLPADRVVKLPAGISYEVAASIMLKGLTAQFLVTSCFEVKAGHIVLVHAAAGGVGILLGQWLNSLGAQVIGTVGSPDKKAVALANGYHEVIDYRAEDFPARVAAITAGRGCDVVYDSVGKDTWRGSLKSLRKRGMFVSFGQSSGAITDFKIGDLAAGGSLYACRPTLFDFIITAEDLQQRSAELFARLASGTVQAHVGQRFRLRDAPDAHRALAARSTIGASVLVPE